MNNRILALMLVLIMCMSLLSASAEVDGKIEYKIGEGHIEFDTATGLITSSYNVTDVIIPSSIEGVPVVGIDADAFRFSKTLRSVTIPSSVLTIGDRAFAECSSLESVILGEGVTEIGQYAFSDCSALVAIDLPMSVTTIGLGAFAWCESLAELTGGENVADADGISFWETAWRWESTDEFLMIGKVLIAYNGQDSVPVIPEGTVHISYGAFAENPYVETINLPRSVRSIGEYAFAWSNISSITLPDGITSIGQYAFADCTMLNSVAVPSTVKSVERNTFEGCTSLVSVTLAEGIERIGSYAFESCESLVAIDIPASVTFIDEYAFFECALLETVTGGEGLQMSGRGVFYLTPWRANYTEEFMILGDCLVEYRGSASEVIVPDGIVGIGGGAFSDRAELAAIEIPVSVKGIGNGAFSSCSSLANIVYCGSEASWILLLSESDTRDNGYLFAANVYIPVSFNDVQTPHEWFHDPVYAAANKGIVAGNPDGTFRPYDTLTWAQTVTFAVRLAQYNAGERIYTAADQTAVWYEIYADYAMSRGIIDSIPSDPNTVITRGDAAVIFAAVLGDVEQVNAVAGGYFVDVAAGSATYDAVYALSRAGITNGKGGGVFDPNGSFLRNEVATIVARMAGLVAKAKIDE